MIKPTTIYFEFDPSIPPLLLGGTASCSVLFTALARALGGIVSLVSLGSLICYMLRRMPHHHITTSPHHHINHQSANNAHAASCHSADTAHGRMKGSPGQHLHPTLHVALNPTLHVYVALTLPPTLHVARILPCMWPSPYPACGPHSTLHVALTLPCAAIVLKFWYSWYNAHQQVEGGGARNSDTGSFWIKIHALLPAAAWVMTWPLSAHASGWCCANLPPGQEKVNVGPSPAPARARVLA